MGYVPMYNKECDMVIDREELEMAGEFASTMRGRYIIAKALHYGIQELEKVEGAYREISDIGDMKFLRDNLFNFPILEGNGVFKGTDD